MLTTNYADKQQEWKLVVTKGFTFLKAKLGKSQAEVNKMVNETVIL